MTSIINFKSDPKLKAKAQKKAAEMGVSLTAILNKSLKDFVNKKSISFEIDSGQKTPYGMFSGIKFSTKDIDEITKSWEKVIE